MIKKADYSLIPERIMLNLKYYIEGKEIPGGFLCAVLSNDLFKAVTKADDEMLPLIPLLVHYIHWECPSGCHGSVQQVEEWTKEKRKKK